MPGMFDILTYDFGYHRFISWGLTIPLALAVGIGALAIWQGWPRWITVLAAIGVLQLGNLTAWFDGGLPVACASFSAVYLLGMVLIWFVPETQGQPLPE